MASLSKLHAMYMPDIAGNLSFDMFDSAYFYGWYDDACAHANDDD